MTTALPHCRIAALRHYGITALRHDRDSGFEARHHPLPPDMCRKLGLDAAEHPMMLVELRDGGVFLQPAEALPVRDIPEETLQGWIAEDEKDAEESWTRAGKA